MRYYALRYAEDEHGVARSDQSDLFVLSADVVADWQGHSLTLVDGAYSDYLGNDLGVRLCSRLMRQVLQESAAPEDRLQWLTVDVRSATEARPYFILHFPAPPDVLDSARSLFEGDFVVRPVFVKERLRGHAVFSYAGGGALRLFVNEDTKERLDAAGCTGISSSLLRL